MRFLLDAQFSRLLARKLIEAGHEAEMVSRHLHAEASDVDVARLANRLSALVLTKDEDFVALSHRKILRMPFVWVRCGNLTTSRLWELLAPALPDISKAVNAGQRIIRVP